MTQSTIYLLVVLILVTLLATWYLTKRSKKSNGIILPKDLKESRAEYQARKEDDHRKFNKRKGW
jgi:sensor histidine kinase regulating citrate/malate metabolism